MTIEQVFENAKVLGEERLRSGERMLKLELAPHVRLVTGVDAGGRAWDSTMHTVDFALDDEGHSQAGCRKMLKALGMRGVKDFFLAYSLKRDALMKRFTRPC